MALAKCPHMAALCPHRVKECEASESKHCIHVKEGASLRGWMEYKGGQPHKKRYPFAKDGPEGIVDKLIIPNRRIRRY